MKVVLVVLIGVSAVAWLVWELSGPPSASNTTMLPSVPPEATSLTVDANTAHGSDREPALGASEDLSEGRGSAYASEE